MLRAEYLPLLAATASKRTWADVLRTYDQCCTYFQGIYTPTTEEMRHGLALMPSSWATTLFYYSVVKGSGGMKHPGYALASQAISQFKHAGNVPAMRRVFDEDVNASTPQGAQAALVLASYTGVWETALELVASNPALKRTLSNRRMLISTLCSVGQTARALQLLSEEDRVDPSPDMIRPLVKRLSYEGSDGAALWLTARSLSAGYSLSPSLLSALLHTLQSTGQHLQALETALSLNSFAMPRKEAQRNIHFFNGLVDCLFGAVAASTGASVAEVVDEVNSRMNPQVVVFRPTQRRRTQFRLRTTSDIQHQFGRFMVPLSGFYGRCLGIPRWYSRQVSTLADLAAANDSVVLVLDTNFLLQCVSKNLPMEHFRANMSVQFPRLRENKGSVTVVIPFTAAQEAYTVIWNPRSRLRHPVRMLLWSRLVAFVRQPNTYVLSLTAELPTAALSVLTQMAYAKAESSTRRPDVSPTALTSTNNSSSSSNPDTRVLNVCLALHHHFRHRRVASFNGATVPEGAALFGFLKYHVRRYMNTVKGSACDSVILCTMDKQLSRAAREAGVDCFPLAR